MDQEKSAQILPRFDSILINDKPFIVLINVYIHVDGISLRKHEQTSANCFSELDSVATWKYHINNSF